MAWLFFTSDDASLTGPWEVKLHHYHNHRIPGSEPAAAIRSQSEKKSAQSSSNLGNFPGLLHRPWSGDQTWKSTNEINEMKQREKISYIRSNLGGIVFKIWIIIMRGLFSSTILVSAGVLCLRRRLTCKRTFSFFLLLPLVPSVEQPLTYSSHSSQPAS